MAACAATKGQSKNPLWHSLRYGRITASVVYEASRATDENKSLKCKILGAAKVALTDALKRGKLIEDDVCKEASGQLKMPFETTGLLISHESPHFAASPDGKYKDVLLEIKCPSKTKTVQYYISRDGRITPKVRAQLQLQMWIFGCANGILAVADPEFEKNSKISFVQDSFDFDFIKAICEKAQLYWIKQIFPILIS